MVTPTYYVFFTTATIASSAILFRGFKGGPIAIITVVLGFLQICCGVILLQLSKSAKNVPDTEIFTGDLDQVHTIAEQEEPESEPKADAIRGAVSIVRRFSVARQQAEAEELKRIMREKEEDRMHPPGSQVEWDGVRRRVSFNRDVEVGQTTSGGRRRSNTTRSHRRHAPLGLTRIPDEDEDENNNEPTSGGHSRRRSMSLDAGFGRPSLLPLQHPSTSYHGATDLDPEAARPHTPDTVWSRTMSLFNPKIRHNNQSTSSLPQHNTPNTSRRTLGSNHPYAAAGSSEDTDDEKVPLDTFSDNSPQSPPRSPPQTPTRSKQHHKEQQRNLLGTPKSGNGKRTLSFNIFARHKSSDNMSTHSKEGEFGAPKTEEEMLGLVRQGEGSPTGTGSNTSSTIRPIRTSEDEKGALEKELRR